MFETFWELSAVINPYLHLIVAEYVYSDLEI